MRIVFFCHYFPPEGNAPASRTYEHCIRWVAMGHDVTVITCFPNVPLGKVYPGYENTLWPRHEVIDGVHVKRVWTYLAANSGGLKRILNYVSYMMSAVLTFTLLCRRPHVVVATSPQFFCGWAGVFASWIKWCPLVLEIRDIWPESIITVGAMKKGITVQMLEKLEVHMYHCADLIVAVGNGYKQNILNKVKKLKIVTVVTNGVDLKLFQPLDTSSKFREQYDLGDRFVCSYVGTIGMAHGLSVVVRAARYLHRINREDIVFCLVGDGADRSSMEAQVAEAGVGSMVVFTGRLPKNDVALAIASSDCLLVHLKKSELFEAVIPSKIFESMAMQRPIIMGVRGESAEIVAKSGTGLPMEPENEQQLLDCLLQLSDNKELYENLCSNGRRFVSEHYSRDKLAAQMLKQIESVARKP